MVEAPRNLLREELERLARNGEIPALPWTQGPEYPMLMPCDGCSRGIIEVRSDRDRGKRCAACRNPKPPTRREAFARGILAAAQAEYQERNQIVDAEVRRLHGLGIPLQDLTFVTGDPLCGASVSPQLRHQPSQATLVTFDFEYGTTMRHGDALNRVLDALAPKPPTLREWLGDRASELGRWAEVLREQPHPSGAVRVWTWKREPSGTWFLRGDVPLHELPPVIESDLLWAPTASGPLAKLFRQVFFTRHPDVKPEPRLTIGCEDQHEVMP
jgi:hypothetical protein